MINLNFDFKCDVKLFVCQNVLFYCKNTVFFSNGLIAMIYINVAVKGISSVSINILQIREKSQRLMFIWAKKFGNR